MTIFRSTPSGAAPPATRQASFKPEYKLLARIRNGAETVMSAMRRVYRVDTMPVRGLVRGRLFFGCKIAALQADKLCLEAC